MEQAKVLLETTGKRINEVASITGYDTTAGFIHASRKRFGLTPREWRMQEKVPAKRMAFRISYTSLVILFFHPAILPLPELCGEPAFFLKIL